MNTCLSVLAFGCVIVLGVVLPPPQAAMSIAIRHKNVGKSPLVNFLPGLILPFLKFIIGQKEGQRYSDYFVKPHHCAQGQERPSVTYGSQSTSTAGSFGCRLNLALDQRLQLENGIPISCCPQCFQLFLNKTIGKF